MGFPPHAGLITIWGIVLGESLMWWYRFLHETCRSSQPPVAQVVIQSRRSTRSSGQHDVGRDSVIMLTET